MRIRYPSSVIAAALLCAAAVTTTVAQSADPLPSWNDGKAKQSIVTFVSKVTKESSPEFVPPAERIATFDNDGTLWAEQPLYFQLLFSVDRIKELAPQHPEWKDNEPFKSVLAGVLKAAFAGGAKSLLEVTSAGNTNITPGEFDQIVKKWAATAKHPKTGRLYTEMVYQPMLEVLAYLPSPQAAVPISCARSRNACTAFRPNRSLAVWPTSNSRYATASPCSSGKLP
jgi:hypothetical protein